MIFELFIALFIGVLAGTLTGLTPGIHINLVSVILLSFSNFLLDYTSPIILSVFIISMAITHTFIDFIPSIFLGAPDEDSFLSILPGHRLLLKGKGYFAVVYTLYGGMMALLVILIFTPLFISLLPKIYNYFLNFMGIILIVISAFLIFSDEKEKRLWALIIFLLAGFLGIATFDLNLKEPLLPLLTGLFGASGLIISIKQKTKIPEQKIMPLIKIRLSKKSILKGFLASIVASPFTAFLPGLGASQAAIIGKQMINIKDQRQFLFLLGSINTIVMGLSFITLYAIEKMRTGAAVTVSRLMPEITKNNLFIILLTIIFSGIISFFVAIKLSKIISNKINKINYQKLSLIIFFLISIIVFNVEAFNSLNLDNENKFMLVNLSINVFLTSTFLGIFTISKGVKRIHLMGCLLIPTILFYML